MTDPTFWILARAAGLTAYVLLTLSLLAGLTLKTRILGRSVRPAVVTDVHRTLALTGLGALALHALTLVLDASVRVTPLALLVPGLVSYRPVWVAAGVLAGEAMALVTVSFWLRKRIGVRAWRRLHWLSYGVFGLATVHGLAAGSDSGKPWAIGLYAGAVGAVAAATAWRGLGHAIGGRATTARRRSSRPRATVASEQA